MIQINPFIANTSNNNSITGNVWGQNDDIFTDIDISSDISFNGYRISTSDIMHYAYKFWDKIKTDSRILELNCKMTNKPGEVPQSSSSMGNVFLKLPDYSRAYESLSNENDRELLNRSIEKYIDVYNDWDLRIKYLFTGKSVVDVIESYNYDIANELSKKILEDSNISNIISSAVKYGSTFNSEKLKIYGIKFDNFSNISTIPITNVSEVLADNSVCGYAYIIVDYYDFIRYTFCFMSAVSSILLTNVPEDIEISPNDTIISRVRGYYNIRHTRLYIQRPYAVAIVLVNCEIDNIILGNNVTNCFLHNSTIGTYKSSRSRYLSMESSNIKSISNTENIEYIALHNSTAPLEGIRVNHLELGGLSIEKYMYKLSANVVIISNKNINKRIWLSKEARTEPDYYKYIMQFANLTEPDADLESILK